MFELKFLIRFVLFVTLVQQLVHGTALKNVGKGRTPIKPGTSNPKAKPTTKPLSSSTNDQVAPTSTPAISCPRKRAKYFQGACRIQRDAPWYLQRITQMPWINIAQFSTTKNNFFFQWYTSWGKDVIIYVIDTGVEAGHMAFQPGQIEVGAAVSTDKSIHDTTEHGTGIASNILGKLTGVARQGKIFPITIPHPKSGQDTLDALNVAIEDWKSRSAKNRNLRAVVNVSFDMLSHPRLEAGLELAISSGMHIIHCAGNQGENRCSSGPPVEGVKRLPKMVGQITVAAFTSVLNQKKDKIIDVFDKQSNYGPCVDLVAPGGDILVATAKGYEYRGGTSLSASLTSGVVAALLSSDPAYRDLDPVEFKKKFLVEFTKKGLTGLPTGTPDRMLTIEMLL